MKPTFEQYWEAEKRGIPRHNVNMRMQQGWNINNATTEPVNHFECNGEIPIDHYFYVRGYHDRLDNKVR